MKHAEVRSALLVAVLAVTLLVLPITYSPPSTASAALNQYVWMKILNTTISSIWVGDANYTVVIVGGCVLAVNTSSSASLWEFAPENATVLAAAVLGMVNTDGLYGISCIVANRSQTYLALLNGSSGSIVWTLPAENTTLLATVANRTGDNFTDLIAVDTTIRLIDGATGRIIWEKALNATGTALTLTNSSLVATSCNDTRILWWNVSDGTLLAQIAFNATQLATWNASAVIALNSSHVSLVTLTNILWTLPVNNAFTAFSLSDVNGDGEAELLVVNSSTAFWVNASSGVLLHRVALNGSIVDAATLPPIWANTSDCGYELVVGNDTVIACLDGAFPQTQRFLWTANLTEATRATSLLHISALAVT
ncbi:hypothetical protein DRN94_003260, partial [archaeon]|nr:hypothetical protein [archaeon]